MEPDGTIRNVSKSFTKSFGYSKEEIVGKNFEILFTDQDIIKGKPQLELQLVLSTGQANDDNYTVNKKGDALWCTGESLLVRGKDHLNK